MPAQSHQRLGAPRGCIDPPQELLAWRFHSGGKGCEIRGVRRPLVGRCRAKHSGFVGPKFSAKHFKKFAPLPCVHGRIRFNDFLGQHGLGSFAPLGEQMMAQEIHICAAPLSQQPQQIAQESRHIR